MSTSQIRNLLTLTLLGSQGLAPQSNDEQRLRVHWLDHEKNCDLACALAMCGDKDIAESNGRACVLQYQNNGWWLSNNSPLLMLAINDVRLAFREQYHISDGDRLTIGLHVFRFSVQSMPIDEVQANNIAEHRARFFMPAASQDNVDKIRLAGDERAEQRKSASEKIIHDFDLTNLTEDKNQGLESFEHFLGSVAAEAPVVEALTPESEALAKTSSNLGETQPPVNRHESLAAQTISNIGQAPKAALNKLQGAVKGVADKLTGSEKVIQVSNVAEIAPPKEDEEQDELFKALHHEFLEVIRDPTRLTSDVTSREVRQQYDDSDVFQNLVDNSSHYENLYGVLGESEVIDPVLAQLDVMTPSHILEPEKEENVLHLFAPSNMVPKKFATKDDETLSKLFSTDLLSSSHTTTHTSQNLADAQLNPNLQTNRGAQFAPELTRREHHSVSLDSGLVVNPSHNPNEKKEK